MSKHCWQPVWNGYEFVPRLLLPLSLSYDHRVIDGAKAARITGFLSEKLSDLRTLFVGPRPLDAIRRCGSLG